MLIKVCAVTPRAVFVSPALVNAGAHVTLESATLALTDVRVMSASPAREKRAVRVMVIKIVGNRSLVSRLKRGSDVLTVGVK